MENTKSNSLKKWLIVAALSTISADSLAMDATFQALVEDIGKACPQQWEDPAVALPTVAPEVDGNSFFQDAADIQSFSTFYKINHRVTSDSVVDEVSDAEMAAVLANSRAVAFECNSYRKSFFETLLSTNSADEGTALAAATGVAEALNFISSDWLPGDMRVTGRKIPDSGWLFPTGQTIGASGSDANLADNKYQQLFEVAKFWAPNDGATKTWGSSGLEGVVVLPDLRGRSIYAADNMGGASKGVVTATAADKLGGTFGLEGHSVGITNLPSHNHANSDAGGHGHAASNGGKHKHTMNAVGNHGHLNRAAGNHGHTMGVAGNHGHKLRSSVHTGSGAGRSDWPYFEGRARPNYQSVIQSSVEAAGNHSHSLGAAGNHSHTNSVGGAHTPTMRDSAEHAHNINAVSNHSHGSSLVGGGVDLPTISPGVAMNVEIKY